MLGGALAIGITLAGVGPAQAVPDPGAPIGSGPGGIATEVTISQIRDVSSVQGASDATIAADTPYPADATGPLLTETTALIVLADIENPGGPIEGLTYCIDLHTSTSVGVNYQLDDWTEANVPNLTYVEYILTHYYPTVPTAPAGTAAQQAAAVQAAIWYFTDQFVLSAGDPARAAAAAIVLDAQTNAAGGQPDLPTLTVTPDTAAVPDTGEIVGPFTVGGTVPSGTLETFGVQVFADAAGTQPLTTGATVANGAELWMRYVSGSTPQGFRLNSVQSVLRGNVFLYDGSNPSQTAAQKLILALTTDLPVRAGVAATPFAAGAIQLTKSISGAGAGLQDAITVTATCTAAGVSQDYTATLPAGTGAGDHAFPVISGIPDGAECALAETATGVNSRVVLTSASIAPATVTIAAGTTATATVTNVYDPAPTPTPTPTLIPAATEELAQSGSDIALGAPILAVLLIAGAGTVLGLEARRKRREAGR